MDISNFEESGSWENLTTDLAIKDSPFFRASLQNVEDEVEIAAGWLELFIKNIRETLSISTKLADQIGILQQSIEALSDIPFIDHQTLGVAGETIGTILGFADKLLSKLVRNRKAEIKRLENQIVGPMLQINFESVREMKELRKHYERLTDKYDNALVRSDKTGVKDSFRDEVYLSDTLEYIAKLKQFRSSFELGLLDKIVTGMGGYGDYSWTLGQFFRSLDRDLKRLMDLVPKWQEEATVFLAKLKAPARKPTGMELLELSKKGIKGGHLFRKNPKSIKSSWKRVYAELDGTYFLLTILARQRGKTQILTKTNVLLCEMKIAEVPDRRNCFEIFTSQKSWIFQAENEEDLRDWIRAFEAAKSSAVRPVLGPEKYDSTIMETDDDETVITSSTTQTSSNMKTDYAFSKENDTLHRLLPSLHKDDLVLTTFGALMRLACETYVSGKLYLTCSGIVLIPSSLCPRDASQPVEAVSIEFSKIDSLELVPNGPLGEERLLTQLKLLVKDEIEKTKTIYLMTIDPLGFDILIKLYKNSRQKIPKTAIVLLTDLGLSTSGSKNSPHPLHDLDQGNKPVDNNDDLENEEETTCGCDEHLERTEVSMIIPLSASKLFEIIFADDSKLMQKVFDERGYTNVTVGKWSPNAEFEGRLERQVSFNIPINNPLLKAKDTICNERNIQMIARPDQVYVVETEARTPQAPYGETFVAKSRVCIARAGSNRCRLMMSIGMVWLKSPLVKSIIKDATFKGFARYTVVFLAELKEVLKSMQKTKAEDENDAIQSEQDLEIFGEALKNDEFDNNQSTGFISSVTGAMKVGKEFLGDVIQDFGVGPIRTFIFRYPFAFLIPLLVLSVYLSAWTTKFVWQRLFLSPQSSSNCSFKSDETRLKSQFNEMNVFEWKSPFYKHVFRHLHETEHDIGLLHDELLELARHISGLERHVVNAKHISWLADQLTDCYQKDNNGDCLKLEQNWIDNLSELNN